MTIINARDYAQTVCDLAIRRHLILIGEDMVNAAYPSPPAEALVDDRVVCWVSIGITAATSPVDLVVDAPNCRRHQSAAYPGQGALL